MVDVTSHMTTSGGEDKALPHLRKREKVVEETAATKPKKHRQNLESLLRRKWPR